MTDGLATETRRLLASVGVLTHLLEGGSLTVTSPNHGEVIAAVGTSTPAQVATT